MRPWRIDMVTEYAYRVSFVVPRPPAGAGDRCRTGGAGIRSPKVGRPRKIAVPDALLRRCTARRRRLWVSICTAIGR